MKKQLVVAGCITILLGCDPLSSPPSLEDAKYAVQQNDNEQAIIHLKNIIQDQPSSPEARQLLAKIYFDIGHYAGAEKEFQWVLGTQPDNEIAKQGLYESLFFQDKFEPLLEATEQEHRLSPDLQTQVYVYRAVSHYELGNIGNAKSELEKASDISEQAKFVTLGKAVAMRENENTSDALALVNSVLETEPNFHEARLLQGQLYAANNNYAQAVKSYERFHNAFNLDNKGKLLLADAYVKTQNYDGARPLIDDLLKVSPNHPYINLLKGVTAFNDGNFQASIGYFDTTLESDPFNIAAKMYAGTAAYRLGNHERAYEFLSPVAETLEQSHPVHKMLTDIKINLGYTVEALNDFNKLTLSNVDESQLLFKLGAGLTEKGMLDEVKGLLRKADEWNLNDSQSLKKSGILKVSVNDLSGITDLETAYAKNPDPTTREALIKSYLFAERGEKAEALVENWLENEPQNVKALNIAASVYIANKKADKVKHVLDRALAIAPDNVYSVNYLTTQALEENNTELAITLQRNLALSKNGTSDIVYRYYLLEKQFGEAKRALSIFAQKHEEQPQNLEIATKYAQALLNEGNLTKCIEVIEDAKSKADAPDMFWQLWAEAYLMQGKETQALNIYKNWKALAPGNMKAWLFPIMLRDKQQNFKQALFETDKALVRFRSSDRLQLMRIHYLILTGDIVSAQRAFRLLAPSAESVPEYASVAGHIDYANGNFSDAINKLTQYYDYAQSPRTALIISNAMFNNGQSKESLNILEQHLAHDPANFKVRLTLAQKYANVKKHQSAIQHYAALNERYPNNVVVLNNLSWQLLLEGNADAAKPFAESAFDLAPDNPTVMDTYGLALMRTGEVAKAEKVLQQALTLAPDKKTIQEHLKQAQSLL